MVNGSHMLNYKNRIVFTGGKGRFAHAFKKIDGKTKYQFYFPTRDELNILNLDTIIKYLKKLKQK